MSDTTVTVWASPDHENGGFWRDMRKARTRYLRWLTMVGRVKVRSPDAARILQEAMRHPAFYDSAGRPALESINLTEE